MKRLFYIGVVLSLALGLCGVASAQQTQPVLTNFDFTIVGVGIGVSPDYQAVPKGIASQVNTAYTAPGLALPQSVLDQLPKDYTVSAELTGPAYQAPLILTARPGSPFKLPTLSLLGKYTLANIRLLDGTGAALFSATPQAVTIESIGDPLITNVQTRQLTLQEIQDRGVVVDSSNFTAYNFTVALGTQSNQVPISFPVIIPNGYTQVNPEKLPPATDLGIPPPVVSIPPPPELPANTSFEGFILRADPDSNISEEVRAQLPPIPGVVVIPNNIGFLNQYFSALLLVTNGAPGQSNLVVRDLKATVILPNGKDTQPDTNDDPLKMAVGAAGPFPTTLPVMNAGPDGKAGTADDVNFLHPAVSGQADFTVEGKKEGLHKIDFEITAVLEGLPIGPVPIKGKASGAVLVRNPTFSITFSHPATIRSGEGYDIFVTVTNTSKTAANLVSIHLDDLALSGARMAPNETADRQITTIDPNSSATVSYRLIAQRTGKITASAIASDDNVQGRFTLRAGVGERNIPLSPDSLIIPYTGSLPADLVNAAVGLLGQAWSVATAPTGALPSDVLPIAKQLITARANDLSETGIRILMGDEPAKAVADLAFDFLGAENADRGFDDLRRKSAQGLNLDLAMAAVFREAAQTDGVIMLQQRIAERATSRPGHISVVTSESPVRVMITDGANNKIGGINASESYRQILYADQLSFSTQCIVPSTDCTTWSTLSLITKLESTTYRVDLKAEAAASFDLGIVVPDGTKTLRQVTFTGVSLPAGASAWLTLLPNTDAQYALSIDLNSDGQPDGPPLAASGVVVVPDLGPSVSAVTQLAPGFGPGGDKHGRNVAVLFSERVTKESAQNIANYSVDENAVRVSYLQPSGRMVFLLLRDGIGHYDGLNPFPRRFLTVSGITDLKLNAMDPGSETLPIRPRVTGPAAMVSGTVRSAQGEPVPGALVRLLQQVWIDQDYSLEQRFVIFSEKQVRSDGAYQFDYVLQNDDPAGPFMIEAVNAATGESSQLTTNVRFHGQQMTIDLFMKARGAVTGTVRDAAGSTVANAAVLIKTLNDGRSYSTTADASGSFTFTGLRVGPFSLKAVNTVLLAQGQTMGTLPDDGGTTVQDVTIYPVASVKTGTVAGKVLESNGLTPRGGVVVIVNGQNYLNWTRTAADGTYSFTGAYAGPVSISARDELTGMNAVASGQVSENSTSVFNIILKGMGSVSGMVQREDGLSPAGFTVIAEGGPVQRLAVTDSDGTFRFDDLPTGSVSVRLPDPRNTRANLASGTVTLIAAGDTVNILLWIPAKQLATGTITGSVKKRDGSVWNNAEIWLIVDPSAGTYKPYTAVNGTFVIPDPTKTGDVLKLGSHQLVVREGAEIANATAQLWYHGQNAVVELKAAAVGTVSGTVYDEGSGNLPTGADVTLISTKPDWMGWLRYDAARPVTVKSDPQTGRYSFPGVFAGSYSVSASNILRPVPAMKSGAIATNGENAVVDLYLKDTFGSISGTVLRPDGSAAADGVSLSVTVGGALITVATDTMGRFHFAPVIPAGNYAVFVEEAATLRRARASVAVPAGKDVPVTIKLLGKGGITVNVVDGNGAAVAARFVKVKGTDFPNDFAGMETVTSGTVTFGNLSEGVYAVDAVDYYNLGGRTTVTIAAEQAQVTATVTIAFSGTVTGRFLKADGTTAVTGGQITLKNAYRQVLAYTLTSSDPLDAGSFRLEHVPLGDFILEGYDPVSDRRGVGGGRISTNNQTAMADVIVTPRGTVKGTVMNNAGTMPVDNASVSISVAGVSSWSYSTVTSPDGGFTFAGVPAGAITVYALDKATGLSGRATGTLTYEGETVKTDIRLQATGSIEGTVYLPGGTTTAINATVTMSGVTKQVDANGSFLFTNLPSGSTYSVVARELGTNRAGRATAPIAADGEIAHADIVLQGIGTVEGYVYDSNGTSLLKGASVTLYATGKGGLVYDNFTASSNLDTGLFHFTNVPVGTFTARATYPNKTTAASASGSLLAEGDVVATNLKLGDVGTVSGTVLLANASTPAAGGAVRYTGCGLTFVGAIGSDGGFTFDNVPLCGSFSLYLEDPSGVGIGRATGSLTADNPAVNIGTIILDDQAPAVTAVTPVAGTANVSTGDRSNYPITIVFSEPVKADTVAYSVYLTAGSARVSGTASLSPDGKTATFTPWSGISGFTVYTIVATTGVTDLAGRPLAAAFSSSFTTVDVTPPTVLSISPAFGNINVPVAASMRVTFSEAVEASSISAIRLSLDDGSYGVPQTVTVTLLPGNTVAVVSKTGGLLPNAAYLLTVSGVKDPAGNMMQGTEVSRFSTLDTIAPTISSFTYPPGSGLIQGNNVTLTASVTDADVAFVDFFVDGVLAATVSNPPYAFNHLMAQVGTVTVTAAAQDKTGNRTPAADQPVISLAVAPDQPPTISMTAPDSVHPDRYLSVTVYASDDLSVKEIILDGGGAFTFKESRSIVSGTTVTHSFSKLVPANAQLGGSIQLMATARDSGGKTVQTFWTVMISDTIRPSVSISSPGQTNKYKPGQQGTATVVASDLIGVVSTSCTATGAAQGGQAFVIDPAEKQVSRDFTFTVSSGAAQNAHITITCTASDAAQNTQDAILTLLVGDNVRPTVMSSSPTQNAVNVPIDATVSITFSEAMKPDTVYGGTNGTVILRSSDGAIIAGTVSLNTYNYQVVTFTPSPALARETTYTLTITTGVADQADNYLAQDYVLSFTTVPIDRTPPTVVSVIPAPGTIGISVGTTVVATFSEAVNPATVTKDSFVLSSATGTVAGVLSFTSANSVATLRPAAQLDFNKEYSVLLTTQITDSTGNALVSAFTSTFRTGGFSITSPRDRASIISGSTTSLSAVADGSQGIQTVRFYVDNVLAGTKSGAPFTISYAVPVITENTQYVIKAEGVTSTGQIIFAPTIHVIGLLPDGDEDGDGLINTQEIAVGSDPFIVDTDGDGLTDFEEVMSYHTDPTKPDTDGDGLTDYDEVRIYHTEPLKKDTDGDRLTDYEEVNIHHTDPLTPDTDGDGLLDGWEVKYGLDPLLSDTGGTGVPDGDKDIEKDPLGNIIGDGIPNKFEQCLGLDPTKAMTNGVTADGQRDDDRDGLKNIDELTIYHTNPCLADTDGDGVIDSDEINVLLTNPNDRNDLYGKDLYLSGKTIRIEGKALFSSLTVTGNSTITILGASTTQISKADIEVTGTLSIADGSRIDVSGKGYLGAYQGLNRTISGMTRDAVTGGPTTTGGSKYGSGGSHGGVGGQPAYANVTYGELTNPGDAGSGGGGSGPDQLGRIYLGGNGGGFVRIKAGTVSLNGSISADGNGVNSSGGSAGGIWIETGTLSGTGTISAKGGASGLGGGGGRISIYYNSLSLSRTKILASGGKYGTGSTAGYNGGAGTIYLRSSAQTYGEVIINNDGTDTTNKTPVPGGIYDSVEISGGASILPLGEITSRAGMTISNSRMDYTGHLSVPGNLTINNSQVKISDGLSVQGNMILSGSTATISGLVTADGSIELKSGSVLMHSAATATAVSWLEIEANNLLVDNSSKIDATGLGYLGAYQGYVGPAQVGNQTSYGMTRNLLASVPTPTTTGGSTLSGSYGGVAGNSTGSTQVNVPYGSLVNADDVGSGGGGFQSPTWGTSYGGNGGGLIKIKANTLLLDGWIIADGAIANYSHGSGGGIRIETKSISGGGHIRANGGGGTTAWYGGGGGRIAVFYDVLGLAEGNISATGGMSGTATVLGRNGGAGTIYLKNNNQQYGSLIVGNVALNSSNQTPIPSGTYASIKVNGGATMAFAGDIASQTDIVIAGSGMVASGSLAVPSSVMVTNGRMEVANGLDLQGSLLISTSTVTVAGSLKVSGALMLQDQGILTTAEPKAATVSRLDIQAGSIAIDESSKIDVSNKGYLGSQQGNNSTNDGMTVPGMIGSNYYTGGSYGGIGGAYTTSSKANAVYGNLMLPDESGSGGGGINHYQVGLHPGGNGGGLVTIQTGSLNVYGGILANGGNTNSSANYLGGGGSGGGILIRAVSLDGTGSVSASGGLGSNGGGGGGGRIAIYYETISALMKSKLDASGGKSGTGATFSKNGGAGTIYLKSDGQFRGDLIIDNRGLATTNATPVSGGMFASMNVTGGAVLAVTGNVSSETGLAINNTQMTLFGGLTLGGDLIVSGSTITASGTILVAGKLALLNQTALTINSATTTTVSRIDIQAGEVEIDGFSKIDVSGKGYLGGNAVGNSSEFGMTYNTVTGGQTAGSGNKNGGAYGGVGGYANTSRSIGAGYGDLAFPRLPGSGGGGGSTTFAGGNGGGVVSLSTVTITLHGKIVADGSPSKDGTGSTSGAGSGGGIIINAKDITGTGIVRAAGGGSSTNGAGGGGRIAIYYKTIAPDMVVTAVGGMGGISSVNNNGGAGTIYFKEETALSGDLIIDNGGTASREDLTPLRSIGRGQISSVTANSLTNSNASWVAGSLKGLKIKPDISQDTAYTIVDNTATSITIDSSNASLVAGKTYSGVYRLRGMQILGGANVVCDDQIELADDMILRNARLVAREISANNITIDEGGLLTHRPSTKTSSSRLELHTLSALTIAQTATIDVSAKGYLGAFSGDNTATYYGRTYGNTTASGSYMSNGGSFGGLGGLISGQRSTVYAGKLDPDELGTGGGGLSTTHPGGNGGGLVRIEALSLTLNGNILADGGVCGTGSSAGGGSGGGVLIRATSVSGDGYIRAIGGSSPSGGGGGGGIIAINASSIGLVPANVDASGGQSGDGASGTKNGAAGPITLW